MSTPDFSCKCCVKYNKSETHIKLHGDVLLNTTESQVFDILKQNLDPIGLLHVSKKLLERYVYFFKK